MYIAVTTVKKKHRFVLRESCTIDDQLTHRDLLDLGQDPSKFIKYPGGNAFYFDERLEDALTDSQIQVDDNMLEDLFWPWLRPDIRRAVDTFKGREGKRKPKLTDDEKKHIHKNILSFDKRRAHYLKFANMDQGPVENMPEVLFRDLVNCSRDEIEQRFFKQEYRLKPHELKSYVYTIFNLQKYFQGFLAKKMPQALDQDKVDTCFLKELCRINDRLFTDASRLDHYMIRYAVMFFDNPYADTKLLDELSRDFMFRHRSHRPMPPPATIPVRTALKAFDLTKAQFKAMDKKQLTRQYRNLARKVHPDTGGSHDDFVKLNTAFQTLLGKIKPGQMKGD